MLWIYLGHVLKVQEKGAVQRYMQLAWEHIGCWTRWRRSFDSKVVVTMSPAHNKIFYIILYLISLPASKYSQMCSLYDLLRCIPY